MSEVIRVNQEPAWLLHHRPFRDTSRILDVITRTHGRLSLVARGARSAKSRLRGLLRPFMPLEISWFSRSDMGTLTGAEIGGAPVSLTGDALLSGYYINELIMNMLHRHDPQAEIFDAYAATVRGLAAGGPIAIQLRQFEIAMLGMLGYALVLNHDNTSQAPLESGQRYEYRVEQGPVRVGDREGAMIFFGHELHAISRAEFDDRSTLECANRLLRGVIAYHLNGKELKSRKVLREIRKNGYASARLEKSQGTGFVEITASRGQCRPRSDAAPGAWHGLSQPRGGGTARGKGRCRQYHRSSARRSASYSGC